ncbi:lipid A-modifier LpxR family protein [Hymenobacter daeguensis]
MRLLLLLFLCLPGRAAPAPPDTLRPLSPARLLRYTYANDLFFRTDYYFTQGMTLTLVHPVLARLPTRHLLAGGPAGSTQTYGATLRYDGFTPLRIQDAFIRVGDRPYAAYLYASVFRVSNAPDQHQQLTTALELGFMGPAAGGKALQTAIHRITGNAEPRGWDYQVRNAPIVGYRVAAEKRLAAVRYAELLGAAEVSLGTLYSYAGTGLHLQTRHSPAHESRLKLYAAATLDGRLIGYDATLQGSPLSSHNPYTLAAGAVRRAVVRSSGSVALGRERLRFEATATWVSPEFAGGRSHRWGQLGMTVGF